MYTCFKLIGLKFIINKYNIILAEPAVSAAIFDPMGMSGQKVTL